MEQAHSLNVILPSRALQETSEWLIFETQKDAVFKAGQLSVDVEAIEGETIEEIVGTSDGEACQEFYLPRSGVIEILDASIAGHTWEIVESLADQSKSAEVFTVEIDAWRRANIFFGDGINGKIPPEGERITVRLAHITGIYIHETSDSVQKF